MCDFVQNAKSLLIRAQIELQFHNQIQDITLELLLFASKFARIYKLRIIVLYPTQQYLNSVKHNTTKVTTIFVMSLG